MQPKTKQNGSKNTISKQNKQTFREKVMETTTSRGAFAEPKKVDRSAILARTKKSHPDSVVIIRCGDFYTFINEEAEAANSVLGLEVHPAREQGVTRESYFSFFELDTYLPRLIRAGYKVAIVG